MRATRAGDGVKLMNYMALMGAGVALVVGAFLIYTTMTMAITQRRPVISMCARSAADVSPSFATCSPKPRFWE